MKQLHILGIPIILLIFFSTCCCQNQKSDQTIDTQKTGTIVGGGCDGCELMYEGIPNEIKSLAYSPNWNDTGQKLLITGTVYKIDGKTPAPQVILYYWQTDDKGVYSKGQGKSERHGYIRGWVKSDALGKYALYTRRPAPYPNQKMPAHIHIAIKELQIEDEYYIDEFVFDDDVLLTPQMRIDLENRGGSGVLTFLISDDMQVAEHNIILGLNIPHYPDN